MGSTLPARTLYRERTLLQSGHAPPSALSPMERFGGTNSLQDVPKTLVYSAFAGNHEKQSMDFQKENGTGSMWWLCGGLPHMSWILGCVSRLWPQGLSQCRLCEPQQPHLSVPAPARERLHAAHHKQHGLHLAWCYGLRLRTGKEAYQPQGFCYGLNCGHQKDMLKSQAPLLRNVTLFGDRVLKMQLALMRSYRGGLGARNP